MRRKLARWCPDRASRSPPRGRRRPASGRASEDERVFEVEVRGRLVEQQEVRLGGKAARNRRRAGARRRTGDRPGARAEAPRSHVAIADSMARRSRSPSRSKRPRCGCRPMATISSTVKREVAACVLRQKREPACDVAARQRPIGQAVERDRPARGCQKPASDPQQRALAAAVRADDRGQRPRRTATRRGCRESSGRLAITEMSRASTTALIRTPRGGAATAAPGRTARRTARSRRRAGSPPADGRCGRPGRRR